MLGHFGNYDHILDEACSSSIYIPSFANDDIYMPTSEMQTISEDDDDYDDHKDADVDDVR